MIQIESIHIQELRGIRDLKLTMNHENFVVSGPNGSGKSGVVDAIQFALTGEIGRLKGSGTGDLTLSDHGPHVEKRSDPDAASVCLKVFIPRRSKILPCRPVSARSRMWCALSSTLSHPVFLQHFIARDYSFQLPEIGAMHNWNKRDLIDVAESRFKCVIGMQVG